MERLIAEWGPESVAVERAFVGKNVLSALRLGEIRGAVLAVAGRHALPVVDYPPATVKLDANSTDGRIAGERYHIYGVPTIIIAQPDGDIKTSLEGVWASDAIQLAMDKAQPR